MGELECSACTSSPSITLQYYHMGRWCGTPVLEAPLDYSTGSPLLDLL